MTDGFIIKVPAEAHHLDFMNVPKANKVILDANVLAGNVGTTYMMSKSMLEGTISESLEENDLLMLTIISDDKGKILDLPDYHITPLDDEGVRKIEELYQEQAKEGYQADGSNVKVEFILCLLLGWLGVHKFYRGKTFMGFIYLFSFGLFSIGWIIDTIVSLFKVIKTIKAK